MYQGHPVSKNMMEDEDVRLTCDVYGFPRPIVTWKVAALLPAAAQMEQGAKGRVDVEVEGKDVSSLNGTEPVGRFFLHPYKGIPGAELLVKRLQFEDRAQYTCCASNKHNLPTQPSCEFIMVRVKGPLLPRPLPSAPVVKGRWWCRQAGGPVALPGHRGRGHHPRRRHLLLREAPGRQGGRRGRGRCRAVSHAHFRPFVANRVPDDLYKG